MRGGTAGEPISVPTAGGGSYGIHVARGIRQRLGDLVAEHVPAERYALVSDERVASLYADQVMQSLGDAGLEAHLLTFPAGEGSKSREEWARLSDALLAKGFGRSSTVLAVGGGVTGDLAGFVAATYMRGVPVVQVPTTLLAMVDASVGGKTGLNVALGKNLIGAFHAPALVLVDPEFTRTLPRERRAEGLAEALKHGAIRDAAHFQQIVSRADALLDGEPAATGGIVERSVRIKAEVVGADEREAGLRETLNFGHTLGHGLEAASGYQLAHGSAVALGMLLEAALGERLGVTRAGTREDLLAAVGRLELPTLIPGRLDPARVMEAIERDKKVRGDRVRVVLLESIGAVARSGGGWARPVASELVDRVVREACEAAAPA